MALTMSQKSAVRWHLGYPVAGLVRLSPAGGSLASGAAGYRFTQAYGFLEYKMNNLNPDEEARLVGNAFASVAFLGPQPNPGDTATVTLSGGPIPSPQTLTVTQPVLGNLQDARLYFANALAAACSLNPVLQSAGVIGVAPYGTGPYTESVVPLPEVAFESPLPFSISASGTGVLAPQITATGEQLDPSTSLDGVTTIWGYINILNGLWNAFGTASQNLDTLSAGPWRARANEIGYRMSLYRMHQQALSDFLGTPINPQRMNRARTVGALRYA